MTTSKSTWLEVVASSIEKNDMPDAIYYIMASIGPGGRPSARTVALRGILTEQSWKQDPAAYSQIPSHLLHFSANRMSSKIKAMIDTGDNRVELVKFYAKTKQQLRISGVMHIRFANQKEYSGKLDFPSRRLFDTYIKPHLQCADEQQMDVEAFFDLQRKKLWDSHDDRIRSAFGSIPPKDKNASMPDFCVIGAELTGNEDEATKEWYHRAWDRFCQCIFEPDRVELMEMMSGGRLRIWSKENNWVEDMEWA